MPKVVLMGSGSVSVESVGTNFNNTSTDSSNTVITMVTVTDSGETEDSFDHPPEDMMRITTNLLEDMLGPCNTPGSSVEKEDEFFSASSTEEQPKPCEEVKLIFQGVEEEDDTNMILLQHTKIPVENTKTIVEETSLPILQSTDPAVEWYNIKMRQANLPQNKNNLSANKRLKMLSKRYAKNNFEDEPRGRKHGRNSSGFAAEQMTIESEEDPTAVTASPPIPDSPTAIQSVYQPTRSPPPKTETIFTFPDIHEEKEKEREKEKSPSVSKKLKTEKDASNDSCKATPTPTPEPTIRGTPATIVVQQASVTGNSPEFSGSESISQEHSESERRPSKRMDNDFKQLLDVTNNITIQQMHDSGLKYCSPHHSRSQSVKTPGSRSNIQPPGASRHRPNYLCLPQQRSRVASMPNTGVEEEYYRLRHFSITGKGVVNRGDSLKSRRSRSNNSVASSNSSHSTEHLTTGGAVVGGSYPGSARTSATTSLASSRESSCASCPGITAPFRVVMLGSAGVGKSSLISQFMTSEYLHAYDTSIGSSVEDDECGEKSVSVLLDGEESELTFIDHPSSEMSPEDCLSNYTSPHAYCVVYSTADRGSFQQAEQMLQTLWKNDAIRTKAVILVANKTDLVRSRVVSTQDGKLMATAYDCKFIETSVGINHNVDELLVGILTQIRLKLDNPPETHYARRRSRSPMSGGPGFRKYRGQRTSASLKVKGLLSKVWARDSKSKSCENLHVL
ncbi:uncharacterized protein LOC128994092 isoform X1 [Macrosteles quadrilineatus]|uniref:uncharacterized protein LOC128994092 isoform X1 n=1 Tax=Macrosteles quadrilineatus TaxID=74068 RepID=UPI0023E0930E|nr:uncharacterized protein LOC128994092 isoform X1 [Macrosteles quadrilineatus]